MKAGILLLPAKRKGGCPGQRAPPHRLEGVAQQYGAAPDQTVLSPGGKAPGNVTDVRAMDADVGELVVAQH